VHVNPSLDPKSLVRDGLFILIAKLWRRKTLVFFRGWHADCENQIQRHWRLLFKCVFGRADVFVVLAEAFKRRLISWIDGKPVYREFTVLDDGALLGFDFQKALYERQKASCWRIVFISRLIKEKGLYEAIDAVGPMPGAELVVVGDGPELEPSKKYAAAAGYGNIHFTGYIRGEKKVRELSSAHMLCFPTYGEGMPNTVAECMGFGLPVITRPVGGIADFFENGVHGFATASKSPHVFAELIRSVMADSVLYRTMAINNYNFAQTHFRASQAAIRLERIYKAMIDSHGETQKTAKSVSTAPA
jgi:glycosyltransferase involved in cell wall biosynthesis